jgi:hypothetical protein
MNLSELSTKLRAIASGETYYENALRTARNLSFLELSEREELTLWLTGSEKMNSHRLQDIAIKLHNFGSI